MVDLNVQTVPTTTPTASSSVHQDTHSGENAGSPAKAAGHGAVARVCVWVGIIIMTENQTEKVGH